MQIRSDIKRVSIVSRSSQHCKSVRSFSSPAIERKSVDIQNYNQSYCDQTSNKDVFQTDRHLDTSNGQNFNHVSYSGRTRFGAEKLDVVRNTSIGAKLVENDISHCNDDRSILRSNTKRIRDLTATGSYQEALQTFDNFTNGIDFPPVDDHLCCAAMTACLKGGWPQRAIDIYFRQERYRLASSSVVRESGRSRAVLDSIALTAIEKRIEEIQNEPNILISALHSEGVHNSENTTSTLLQQAEKIFDRQKSDLHTFTNMIRIYGQCGNVEKVLTTFNEIGKQGLRPSLISCIAAITAIGGKENMYVPVDESVSRRQGNQLNEANISATTHASSLHETISRTKLIRTLTRKYTYLYVSNNHAVLFFPAKCLRIFSNQFKFFRQCYTEALKTFEGYPTSLVDCHLRGAAMTASLRAGWFGKVLELYHEGRESERTSLQLTSMALTAIEKMLPVRGSRSKMNTREQTALVSRADEMFENIQKKTRSESQKSGPDVHLYTNMITIHGKIGTLETALRYLDRMKGDNLTPSAIAYAAAIKACARLGIDMDGREIVLTDDVVKKAWSLWEKLKKVEPYPPLPAYSSILAVCQRSRSWDQLDALYNELKESQTNFDSILCTEFINGFGKAGRYDRALKVFDEFICSTDTMDFLSGNDLDNCKEKSDTRSTTLSEKSRLILYSAAISVCEKARFGEKALTLFTELSKFQKPDCVACASVLSACEKSGLYAQGLDMFETLLVQHESNKNVADIDQGGKKMNQRTNLNAIIFGVALRLCEKAGNPERAVELIEQMNLIGILPDFDTYRDVLSACEVHERWDLAAPLLRRLEENVFEAFQEQKPSTTNISVFKNAGRIDCLGSGCLQLLARYGVLSERLLHKLAHRLSSSYQDEKISIVPSARQLVGVWESVESIRKDQTVIQDGAPKSSSQLCESKFIIVECCAQGIANLISKTPNSISMDISIRVRSLAMSSRVFLGGNDLLFAMIVDHSTSWLNELELVLRMLTSSFHHYNDNKKVGECKTYDKESLTIQKTEDIWQNLNELICAHDVKSLGLQPTKALLLRLGFILVEHDQRFSCRARKLIHRTRILSEERNKMFEMNHNNCAAPVQKNRHVSHISPQSYCLQKPLISSEVKTYVEVEEKNGKSFAKVIGKASDSFRSPHFQLPVFRHLAWNHCTKAHAEVAACTWIVDQINKLTKSQLQFFNPQSLTWWRTRELFSRYIVKKRCRRRFYMFFTKDVKGILMNLRTNNFVHDELFCQSVRGAIILNIGRLLLKTTPDERSRW